MGAESVEEGLGIVILGVGRSWTEGLGVAEEVYLTAGTLLGSGLGSGTGLDWDFGAFCFVTVAVTWLSSMFLVGDLGLGLVFWVFFFFSFMGLGAASSSLETALRFWVFGSTSITASALTFALAGEDGGVDFRGLL